MIEMPLYQSHKKVRALEIAAVRPAYGTVILEFAEPGHPPKLIDSKMCARYVPVPGDFYVVYEDGYDSISPRQPFLDGYTRLDPSDGAMPDNGFARYRRSQIAELRPYVEGETLSGVSISTPDMEAGSPKAGDMIARNPKNHADKWLVAAQYFADNFESAQPGEPPGQPTFQEVKP